jgi:hypothetical protein
MKSTLSIISTAFLMVFIIFTSCIAQSKKAKSRFPKYEEIRGNKGEINDFIEPRTLNNDYKPVLTKTIQVDKYWNAFNYPANSTVYYLNGKQVKSQKDAKKELDEQSASIERVSVGAVNPNGKRDVEIDYHVKPKN